MSEKPSHSPGSLTFIRHPGRYTGPWGNLTWSDIRIRVACRVKYYGNYVKLLDIDVPPAARARQGRYGNRLPFPSALEAWGLDHEPCAFVPIVVNSRLLVVVVRIEQVVLSNKSPVRHRVFYGLGCKKSPFVLST